MNKKNDDKIKKLLELGEEIYNHTQNAEATMYLGYAWGLADSNKKCKKE